MPAFHHSVFTGRMPSCQQHQSTEGKELLVSKAHIKLFMVVTAARGPVHAKGKGTAAAAVITQLTTAKFDP